MQLSRSQLRQPKTIIRHQNLELAINKELALLFEEKDYPLRLGIINFAFFDALQRMDMKVHYDQHTFKFKLYGKRNNVLYNSQKLFSHSKQAVSGSLLAILDNFTHLIDKIEDFFPDAYEQFSPLYQPGLFKNAFTASIREYLPAIQEGMFRPNDDVYLSVSTPSFASSLKTTSRYATYMSVSTDEEFLLRRELVCDYLFLMANHYKFGFVRHDDIFARGVKAFPNVETLSFFNP